MPTPSPGEFMPLLFRAMTAIRDCLLTWLPFLSGKPGTKRADSRQNSFLKITTASGILAYRDQNGKMAAQRETLIMVSKSGITTVLKIPYRNWLTGGIVDPLTDEEIALLISTK